MKKNILLILLLFFSFSAKATGQIDDIILIDGVEWHLLDNPFNINIQLDIQTFLCKEKNLDWYELFKNGFASSWYIKDNKLMLESVEDIPQDTLISIAEEEGYESLVASWFSGTIEAVQGSCIYQGRHIYQRHYETELHIIIAKGEVVDKYLYHNKILTDGFALTGNKGDDEKSLNENFAIDLNNYSDLKGKKVGIEISNIKVNPCGELTNFKSRLIGANMSNVQYYQLEEDIKNLLYNITWKTMLINGEVKPYTNNFVYPLNFKD
ncbi:MAG: hypothetical protein J6X22_09680 [Muribaculaceae bacterium]|nr:hypothetical protein [Muribaculaceae bacterium]